MRRNHEVAVKSVMAFLLALAALLGALPNPDGGNVALAKRAFPVVRFHFKIDPKTPDADLLPVPPAASKAPRALINDLTQVPEIFFEKPVPVDPALANHAKLSDEERQKIFGNVMAGKHKAMADIAHQIAKIDHLNKQKLDRFLEVLLAARPDLQGLPFALGDACRLSKARSLAFTRAAFLVRTSFDKTPKTFWTNFADVCKDEDTSKERKPEEGAQARTAALVQMLGAEPAEFHVGLVEHLARQADADATRGLARLAVFSPDDPVRRAAVAALQQRKPPEYASILVAGLRYPWPSIARYAADAVADLERRELAPELIGLLDEPDPRAPFFKEVNGRKTALAREVVRINHQRNCLLCHAPGLDVESTREAAVGAVPTPDLPLDSLSTGYRSLSPDIVVRADVTYLRPDFSLMQKVANPDPWPVLQRYDFLVRTRTLTAAEAAELQQALATTAAKPYREAALSALRRLTGADAGESAEAWKRWFAGRPRAGG